MICSLEHLQGGAVAVANISGAGDLDAEAGWHADHGAATFFIIGHAAQRLPLLVYCFVYRRFLMLGVGVFGRALRVRSNQTCFLRPQGELLHGPKRQALQRAS